MRIVTGRLTGIFERSLADEPSGAIQAVAEWQQTHPMSSDRKTFQGNRISRFYAIEEKRYAGALERASYKFLAQNLRVTCDTSEK